MIESLKKWRELHVGLEDYEIKSALEDVLNDSVLLKCTPTLFKVAKSGDSSWIDTVDIVKLRK